MITREFGSNKNLYTVYERPDGYIEIYVYTTNQEFRRILKNHSTNVAFFLQNQSAYEKSDMVAKNWLAKIVSEYRDKFLTNLVLFILDTTDNQAVKRGVKGSNQINEEQISLKNTYKCISLIELGFQLAGNCILNNDLKSGVKYVVDKHKNDRVIYAFCVDDYLKYIGVCDNTNTPLYDRMKRYQGMVGEGTNERVTLKIKDCLKQSHKVTIWALKPNEELAYKDIKVDLVKGLENSLIQKFKPEWNIKG